MVITTTGFYNTGSSVVTNIFQELDEIGNDGGVYEIRLLYDPDCISDLEYNLINNPHRQNTSYAIKRFKKYIDYNSNKLVNHHYEILCKGKFKKISYEYINSICDFKYHGKTHIDLIDRSICFNFMNRCYLKLIRSLFSNGYPKWVRTSLLSDNIEQFGGTFDYKKFLNATNKYIDQIIDFCNDKNKEHVMIDQLFPPTNVERYRRYISKDRDVRVFIVDRDPRDLYVACKYFERTSAIPCSNIIEFCDWFKWTRNQSKIKEDPDFLMRVQYEDLIYDYESTREKVLRFCEMENAVCNKKGEIFKPMESINNTQIWNRYPESIEEVRQIEKILKDYCYDFESKEIKPDFENGKMFEC